MDRRRLPRVSCLVGGRCYNRLVGGKRTKPLLVLIDGHGIIHRAYHAVKVPLTVRSTGEVVTAVYGFANTLLSVFQELKPTHVAVVLDKGKPTLRIAKDATYKAHRPEMPDDLRVQIDRCRELIEAFDIPIYELEHYEADDVLGALARQAVEQGIETYLVSLDSDIAQLVQPNVHLYMYRPYQRDSVIYETPEDVQQRYGVWPQQMPDLKGLKGDTSDNIPGVPGVGDKTAVKLIQQFGSMEGVLRARRGSGAGAAARGPALLPGSGHSQQGPGDHRRRRAGDPGPGGLPPRPLRPPAGARPLPRAGVPQPDAPAAGGRDGGGGGGGGAGGRPR